VYPLKKELTMYEINAIGLQLSVSSAEEAASIFASIPTTRLPVVFAIESESTSIIAATGLQRTNGQLRRTKRLQGADVKFERCAMNPPQENGSVLSRLGQLLGLTSAGKPTA